MEAVVKSLDPNSNANREAVLDTATEIMGFVVKQSVRFQLLTIDDSNVELHVATPQLTST